MVAKQVLRQKQKEQDPYMAELIRRCIGYDPDTGNFTWIAKWSGKRPGDKAGKRSSRGYINLRINNIRYRAHRVAWLLMTGSFPSGVIDHINRNPSNNVWTNLRDTTQSVNTLNCDRSDRVRAHTRQPYKNSA